MSHDLRAPLRAINGYAQILSDDYADAIDTDGSLMITTIKKNALKMGQLIDDLLAFSRLGKKEIQRTDVNMVQKLPVALADFTLMMQVWMNLISNAIKYSAKEKNPVIEIGITRENGVDVFYIKDNGVGFDMKYYNKLFGVFQRLHSSEEFEGTGVGLALVQRIIIKHNGKVWAKAEVNKGATFYFSLV